MDLEPWTTSIKTRLITMRESTDGLKIQILCVETTCKCQASFNCFRSSVIGSDCVLLHYSTHPVGLAPFLSLCLLTNYLSLQDSKCYVGMENVHFSLSASLVLFTEMVCWRSGWGRSSLVKVGEERTTVGGAGSSGGQYTLPVAGSRSQHGRVHVWHTSPRL